MTLDYILNDYQKRDGTFAIRMRITIDRIPQYLPTGIAIHKNQWDAKKSIIRKHPIEDKLNSQLKEFKNEFLSFSTDHKNLGSKSLVNLWKNRQSTGKQSFIEFYKTRIETIKRQGKISSANICSKYLVKLEKYNPNTTFKDLTLEYLLSFEKFMFDRGNRVNTIAANMKYLKSIIKDAIKQGYINDNPFDNYSIKTENSEKETFTYEDILKLESINIEPRHKGQIRARDMFLFAFYNAGMRFGDVCRLKWDNVNKNEIVYVMNKSKKRTGSKRTIPITDKVRAILEKYKGLNKDYIFPILKGVKTNEMEKIEHKIYIGNNAVNRSFKILCKNNKLKQLTFHSAKHSFADYAVKNEIDLLTISKLLGHSRLATTQTYLKDFYQKNQAEAINQMFNNK
ncbi:site-specific integrase [Aquimarina sp. AU119]|uniref:site-specific integrase n=1 Tax=Aquimarina sp. AU119 TaxID=2108528 RepID=UPI000D68D71A|nr:site-specific integrase [Aquimarina sp. AU119]